MAEDLEVTLEDLHDGFNRYFRLLCDRNPTFAAFDSRMSQFETDDEILQSIKHIDFNKVTKILIPNGDNDHWSLFLVDIPQKTITVYDSKSIRLKRSMRTSAKLYQDILNNKLGKRYQWKLQIADSPQQQEGTRDSGVALMTNAEFVSRLDGSAGDTTCDQENTNRHTIPMDLTARIDLKEAIKTGLEINLEAGRLASFGGCWPYADNSSCSASNMARAGFYYKGVRDQVQCFVCQIVLEGWDLKGDKPWQKHGSSCLFGKLGLIEEDLTLEQWIDVFCDQALQKIDRKISSINLWNVKQLPGPLFPSALQK